jgi:ribosomal protein L37AE/L43A
MVIINYVNSVAHTTIRMLSAGFACGAKAFKYFEGSSRVLIICNTCENPLPSTFRKLDLIWRCAVRGYSFHVVKWFKRGKIGKIVKISILAFIQHAKPCPGPWGRPLYVLEPISREEFQEPLNEVSITSRLQ